MYNPNKSIMRHNFKNLKIWKLAMEIAADIHKTSLNFPKSEIYGLTSQMNRASVSMPSNIAEGSNRGNRHFKTFLDISLGSSFELQTQVLIAAQNNYLTKEQSSKLEDKIVEFQKMTTRLVDRLDNALVS
jgi:four helix bundle protein